jgi:hypothetical protein
MSSTYNLVTAVEHLQLVLVRGINMLFALGSNIPLQYFNCKDPFLP